MAVNTAALDGWPSPESIDAAAAVLRAAGPPFQGAVETLAGSWRGLEGIYQAPEQGDVLSVFTNITPHAEVVAAVSAEAAAVLGRFAAGIRELQSERALLLQQLEAVAASPDAGAADGMDAAEREQAAASRENRARRQVGDLAARLAALESACAGELRGLNGAPTPVLDLLGGRWTGLVTGAVQNVAGLYQGQRTQVQATREVPMPWQARQFTLVNGTHQTAEELAGNRILIMDGRPVSIHSPDHPDFHRTQPETYMRSTVTATTQWLPTASPLLERFLPGYRNRVAADRASGNPQRWSQPPAGPRITFGELPGRVQAVKAGSGLLSVASAGVTARSEYTSEYNSLLHSDPAMSEEDRRFRATEVSAVKTTVKTGIDIGAGMAGAAVGTAIGGPAGTLVGFGVGMVISFVADSELFDGRSIKDVAADAAAGAYDMAKDWGASLWKRMCGSG